MGAVLGENYYAAVSAEMPSRIIITNLNFKKMNNLKLNKLNRISDELKNTVVGGSPGKCGCGCQWEGHPGGSTYVNNGQANYDGDIFSDYAQCVFIPEVIVS